MRLLIFTSSQIEMEAILSCFNVELEKYQRFISIQINGNVIDFCHSDPGIFSMSYYLTSSLCSDDYDLVINPGIAGGFGENINPTALLTVKKDCFADVGVFESGVFNDLFDMNLLGKNDSPFDDGWLSDNQGDFSFLTEKLQVVKAVTVNIVSSQKEQIERLRKKYNPDIESMEGAAFFYVCSLRKVNCLQIRSVSNKVGERDKSKWNITESLNALGEGIKKMIYEL